METNIIELTSAHITQLFKMDISRELRYHDMQHTQSVRETALQLADHYRLSEADKEVLEIAALFHDMGYIKTYKGHEEVSQEMAETFLKEHNYPVEKINQVTDLIAATKLLHTPTNLNEQILKDADLNNLGQGKYMKTIRNLKYELALYLGENYTSKEWYLKNLDFLDNHEYYTDYARELFNKKKKSNRKKVKTALKELELIAPRVKKKKEDKDKKEQKGINGNRSAQMMFKTALRNHIDLTSIADNKANIMLSVNALIITITISLVGSKVDTNSHLILPATMLMITSVISIIYATLATRPIKTKGLTDLVQVEEGTTNLFFYGNFYKMPFSNYREGIKIVIQDDGKLDDSITSDLYYLGKALGMKFARLRACYTVFAVGLTLTALAFAISFLTIPPQ